tara:strand:- start:4851 stop:5279 length:429 start_codon:yes stop_codon:yes gene_type:complete
MMRKLVFSIPLSIIWIAAPLPAAAQEDVPVGPTGAPLCGISEDVRATHTAWQNDERDMLLAEVVEEVHLRSGPGMNCESSYLVPAGGTAELVGCGAYWCGIVYGTEAGYLPKSVLTGQIDKAPPLPEDPRYPGVPTLELPID